MVSPAAPDQPASDSGARLETIKGAVIRLAGDSQDGIQTIGGFLARLAGRTDQEVMTYMTIPSTISGGPSIFQVRIGSGEVLSAGDYCDFLVAFYQHSYDAHIGSLRPGGVLLYDTDHVKPNPDDKRFVNFGIAISSLTIEAVGGNAKDKGKNMFVLGLLARVFSLRLDKLREVITDRFGGKDDEVLRVAMLAFDAGYAYPADNVLDRLYRFEESDQRSGRPQVTMDGNQAIAYGAIAAGVRYGSAYPITPFSSIMEILRSELPKYGGILVQAEDEIAAVSIALGQAYAGHLAFTGTSGPGMSLKMEALGWGVMAEIPLIVVDVQRGGPSTGLPTQVEQSDLLQAINGSHGDAPRVVIAPHNVEDCFYITIEAARIARKYSVPVIILSDQSLSSRIEAFDEPDVDAIMVEPRLDLTPRGADFTPYPLDGITQHVAPGTPMAGKYPTVSGLEHDPAGHPSANPAMHQKMTARRREKLKGLAAELPVPEVFGDQDGEVLMVSWGSAWGPVREATQNLAKEGMRIGHMHLRHLHPLPNGLDVPFGRFRRIIVCELNDEGLYGFGQLATILRARYANPAIRSLTKTDGLTFKVREILDGVRRIAGVPAST